MVIHGTAHGRSATLEVAGDTLRWRAHRGFAPIAENIVTTIHEVRFARWTVQRHSWAGLALLAAGGLLAAREGLVVGAAVGAAGALVAGWRCLYPRRLLVLELPTIQLAIAVAASSADTARRLADRIERALATGEVPSSPPMLP